MCLEDSYKNMDEFRDSQKKRIQEALDVGELTTGVDLHQELSLIRAGEYSLGISLQIF